MALRQQNSRSSTAMRTRYTIFAFIVVMSSAPAIAAVWNSDAGASNTDGRRVTVNHNNLPISVSCGHMILGCKVTLQLNAIVSSRRGSDKKTTRIWRITIGSVHTRLRGGDPQIVVIKLNKFGLQLLRRRHRLKARLIVTKEIIPSPASPPAPPKPEPSNPSPVTPVSPPPLRCGPSPGPQLPPPSVGPTSLVGGIYLSGGPPPTSCKEMETSFEPLAGTVEVLNNQGKVVVTQAVAPKDTFDVTVDPGEYVVMAHPAFEPSLTCQSSPVETKAGWSTDVEVVCNVP